MQKNIKKIENLYKKIKRAWENPKLSLLKSLLRELEGLGYKKKSLYESGHPFFSVLYVGNGRGTVFALPGFYRVGKEIFSLSDILDLAPEDDRKKAREYAQWWAVLEKFLRKEGEINFVEREEDILEVVGEDVLTIYYRNVYLFTYENELYEITEGWTESVYNNEMEKEIFIRKIE